MRNSVAEGATGTQAVERALDLLALFDHDTYEAGVTELAGSLGVHKSTASRLAASLERHGFLARRGARYCLGPETARLGLVAMAGLDVVGQQRPRMEEMRDATGETVSLAIPDGDAVLNVAQVDGTYIVGAGRWVGRRTPLHPAANGKVFLAFGVARPVFPLVALTPRTITQPARLEAELQRIRRDGYASTLEELEAGLVAVSGPVFDPAGACTAAVSISGPVSRFTPDRVQELGRMVAGV